MRFHAEPFRFPLRSLSSGIKGDHPLPICVLPAKLQAASELPTFRQAPCLQAAFWAALRAFLSALFYFANNSE